MSKSGLVRKDSSVHKALIARALERFHAELGDIDPEFADVSGPEELLVEARSLEPPSRRRNNTTSSVLRLESILTHINDFAAIIALGSGSEPKVTGVVWGSLRLILMLTKRTSDSYDEVLSMLDELSLALPRFKTYAETLDMTPDLETGLVDVYTEMTCFCARTIRFFRTAPHGYLVRSGWPHFNGDFKQTLSRLKTLSQNVDREAQAARLRMDADKQVEVVEALESMKSPDKTSEAIPCYDIPSSGAREIFGRADLLEDLGTRLCDVQDREISCVLLYGLGGVGKSKLALQFANTRRQDFDAVLWIIADSVVKVQASYMSFARRLGLISKADDADEGSVAVSKVKYWLQTSGRRWLMILDNAFDPEILDYAWPGEGYGSVLITSRNSAAAFGIPSTSLQVEPFDQSLGTSILLRLIKSAKPSDKETEEARGLVTLLGGLPLAITQIGAFIVQNRLTLVEFRKIYERNSEKIDRLSLTPGEQTLGTLWEIAIGLLPLPCSKLLGLLALFDPDGVDESIITDGSSVVEHTDFSFLEDEFSFFQAKQPLFQHAMIERRSSDSTLSMHRLVQTAVWRRLSDVDKVETFDIAVKLLGNGFSNTWNVVTSHQFSSWKQCEARIAHVGALLEKVQTYKIDVKDTAQLSELTFRFAWYLYERELYDQAERHLRAGLQLVGDGDQLTIAAAHTLQGLIELDTSRVEQALQSFLTALQVRIELLHPDDEFIASSHNAISLAYTELNDLDKAFEHGNQAIDIRLRSHSDRIGNSYSNMASTLLRAGQADEAEKILAKCPSLKDFTDETFLSSGNPRFAGDMILLSRIRNQQRRPEEALRLASKALTFRQTTHGDRLKTCDSLQLVADLLESQGNIDSAVTFLTQSAAIAEKLPYAQGYLARAYLKLARLTSSRGDERRREAYETAANSAIAKLNRKQPLAKDAEAQGVLVPWMLW